MNIVKKISLLALVVLGGFGSPHLDAMIRGMAMFTAEQLNNPFAPLQVLAAEHVGDTSLIEKAFSDTFGLVCAMVVRDVGVAMHLLQSPATSFEIDTCARRLTEQINRDYSHAQSVEIEMTGTRYHPLERYMPRINSSLYFSLLYEAVDTGRERLHKKIETLTRLIEDIIAGRQDRSCLDNARILQSTVEFQVSWQPVLAVFKAIKECCCERCW